VILDNGSVEAGAAGDAVVEINDTTVHTDPGHLLVKCPDVSVVKTPDGVNGTVPDGVINAGDTATFTITWTNHGPGTATGVGTNPPNHDVLPSGLTWTESGGDPDNKCSVSTATPNVLTCAGITLLKDATYSVSVSAATDATDCGSLSNTVVLTANGDTNSANNTDTGTITVQCGALRILKQSTKAGHPLVSQPGTIFAVDGPDDGTGTDFNVKDNNTPTPLPANSKLDESLGEAGIGEVCISNIAPGIYDVTETSPPAGYGDGSAFDGTATVVGGTDCDEGTTDIPEPTDAQSAIWRNPPLADLLVRVDGQESGEIRSSISCTGLGPDGAVGGGDDFSGTAGLPIPSDPAVLERNDLEPQVITCEITIDP
jgi:uncharacterized repeat protein (TIGR01451 family)